jgi:predicted dehydrogenase
MAIVGCGVISATHADAIRQLPETELVACCDIVNAKAATFAKKYDLTQSKAYVSLDELLLDPAVDAICVCTPSGLHADVAVPALLAGKHVVIEKPADVSMEACARISAAQQRSGCVATVISQHRFDAASQFAHGVVDRGELGALVLAQAEIKWYRTQDYYDSGDWRGTWALDGGGCLMNQGVHTVDLLRWLGGPVETVYAQARTAAHLRIETEDVVCATLTFKSGAIGTVVASTAAYPGFSATLALHGTNGSVVISGDMLQSAQFKSVPASACDEPAITGTVASHALQVAQGGTKAAEAVKQVSASSDPGALWGDAHKAQLADFVRAVRHGASPLITVNDGTQAVELILAIYESARTGQVVTL